ncbi:hypothetical protein G3480_25465 [Thiorhodococcus mannitoliphagus]|uniref:Uncharacterized protein n=1 Tax=Thiorhodococcus mannitoliphagus TaxID=329406 RepID=A0A6P1E6E3_9GAMM|nr:hypothetical protein [Thiorhodococcus mannitoliphagus]NEX23584.1 hypothetical protein [Thiorhodococcus mannitoliphagus]
MIDNKKEAMELENKIKDCLPIFAYPSKELVLLLKKKNIKLKADQLLEIINADYFGDEGGIVCTLKFPFKTEESFVVSLTHLRPLRNHPLAADIRKYQIRRVRNLAQQ